MEKYLKKRFGTIAVEKEFITAEQLTEAIKIQTHENVQQNKHRLLGQILLDQGLITEVQIEAVMTFMNEQMSYMISMGR